LFLLTQSTAFVKEQRFFAKGAKPGDVQQRDSRVSTFFDSTVEARHECNVNTDGRSKPFMAIIKRMFARFKKAC
jgi:hypothetical protein